MDLNVYMRVFWRFRLLLAAGLVLATVVAVLSLARIDVSGGIPKLDYREQEVYLSSATLFVTQDGFPWGRSILDEVVKVEAEGVEPSFTSRFGDPARYSGLAALYSELAKGDEVQVMAMRGAGPGEHYESSVVKSIDAGAALPMIYINGYGPTPEAAMAMANRAGDSFRRYLQQEQAASKIPESKRVEVAITQRATSAQVFAARSVVRPLFLFLLITMAFIAVAFALENLRPRAKPPSKIRPAEPHASAASGAANGGLDPRNGVVDSDAAWDDALTDAAWDDALTDATGGLEPRGGVVDSGARDGA